MTEKDKSDDIKVKVEGQVNDNHTNPSKKIKSEVRVGDNSHVLYEDTESDFIQFFLGKLW